MHHNLYTSHSCQKPGRFTMRAANKCRSLPDAPSPPPPPHPFFTPFFPFLPSPLLHRTFFSQTVISVETLSPGQTFPHARTQMHVHPHQHLCQMSTPRPHLCASFHGSASLHPETLSRLPSRTCRGKALDGTVSLPASEERGSIIPPLQNLCSGQVWTPK